MCGRPSFVLLFQVAAAKEGCPVVDDMRLWNSSKAAMMDGVRSLLSSMEQSKPSMRPALREDQRSWACTGHLLPALVRQSLPLIGCLGLFQRFFRRAGSALRSKVSHHLQ